MIHQGEEVGRVRLTEQGLYWLLECHCRVISDRVERIYAGQRRLGVLEREGDGLGCRRRLSRASTPELPPASGMFTLVPEERSAHWQGTLAGVTVTGYEDGNGLRFPYAPDRPCPCEPLICFFQVQDGWWRLPGAYLRQDQKE